MKCTTASIHNTWNVLIGDYLNALTVIRPERSFWQYNPSIMQLPIRSLELDLGEAEHLVARALKTS
jgi:hypothetical protein